MTWRAQIPFFCRIFLLNLPFVRTLLDNTCIHEIYADILYTYVNKLYKMIHICHSASAVTRLNIIIFACNGIPKTFNLITINEHVVIDVEIVLIGMDCFISVFRHMLNRN